MFCYQYEQTAKGQGCTVAGVCGKQPDVAASSTGSIDLLIYALKGLSLYAKEGRKQHINDPEMNRFIAEALFSTLTNVNFDPQRFVEFINRCIELRDTLKKKLKVAGREAGFPQGPAHFQPEITLSGLVKQGEAVGVGIQFNDPLLV